jgi:hypothetical protein
MQTSASRDKENQASSRRGSHSRERHRALAPCQQPRPCGTGTPDHGQQLDQLIAQLTAEVADLEAQLEEQQHRQQQELAALQQALSQRSRASFSENEELELQIREILLRQVGGEGLRVRVSDF